MNGTAYQFAHGRMLPEGKSLMIEFLRWVNDRAQNFLREWALFDSRQVLAIIAAVAALLLYAHMSNG